MFLPCWLLLLSLLSISAFARNTHTKRDDGKGHFVSQQGEKLFVNGRQVLIPLILGRPLLTLGKASSISLAQPPTGYPL